MSRYKADYTGEKCTEVIKVKVTPTDRGKIERAAAKQKQFVSTYVRSRALAQHNHHTPLKEDAAEIIKLLTTIGNNLIQIAAGGVAASSLRGVLDQLKEAIARILKW